MRSSFVIVLVALILIIGGLFLLNKRLDDSNIKPTEPAALSPAKAENNEYEPLSPMAQVLHNESSTPEKDLKALGEIFRYYTLEPSGQIPTGTNREITRALTERKPHQLPYLPADHRAITAEGELADRWNTPYFFHAISSREMEIRSAGPDRTMFTEDDLLWPDARQQHQGRQTSAIDLGL